METLWPEEDPEPLANRLSVLLSTIRAVLDPQRRFEPDHFVRADRNSVGLDLANVDVDVERFLSHADTGLTLYRQARGEEATSVLELAASAYTGDFLEEDLYEDWAATLREEARAAYVAVARALAEIAASAGDHESALRYVLRILERDRYDERAHLDLVSILASAGRHGEARRAYEGYVMRMAEIAVEPAPFPT
jgi:DNA-binding SARP family transcriptional activator